MSDAKRVDDLIARLEAATKPDATLDVEILDAILPRDYERIAPAYTTSIDAALMLVPEHIEFWTISFSRNKTGRQYCHVTLEQSADSLGRDMQDDEPTEIEAINAATPAIALCIAALRARQSGSKP